MDQHFHPLRVRSVRRDTDEAVVVAFDVPPALAETYRYRPGQYLTLRRCADDAVHAGDELRRSYSICSALGDDDLCVGVRKVRGGVFSTWMNEALRPGDLLDVMPPQGRFCLPDAPDGAFRHLLCIAGGSGITPILSIARTLLMSEPHSRVTLIYGNRTASSTMFRDALCDLKDRYMARFALHPVYSEAEVDTALQRGLLNREKLAAFIGPVIDVAHVDHAFICGPYAMNDEAEAALLAAGLDASRIHIERFGVPPPAAQGGAAAPDVPQPGDAAVARLVVTRDGATRDVNFGAGDASVLDAVRHSGMDAPYSCRSGVCGTCRARVLEGQVRMARNFALDAADLAAGFVLTCQARPTTPLLRISYDER